MRTDDGLGMLKSRPLLFAGLASALILGAAYGFQIAGYPPCELCWYQRYPYMGVIAVALLRLFIAGIPKRLCVTLCALLFLTTGAIGFYHWGVEFEWWAGPGSCSAGLDLSGSPEDALAAIMAAPLVRCDEVAWSLFGLSMAGYNMLIGFGLAAIMLIWRKAPKA